VVVRRAAKFILPGLFGIALLLWTGGALRSGRSGWDDRSGSGDPAQVLFQAMGAFRVFAIDALWMRMREHQSEGRDGMVLTDARTLLRLDPDSAEVRDFLHWHLAFNMAHRAVSDASRAQWIEEGLDIQHEGLDRDPSSGVLNLGLGLTLFMRSEDEGVFRDVCLRRYGDPPVRLAARYLEKAYSIRPTAQTLLFLLQALKNQAAFEAEQEEWVKAGRLWARAADFAVTGLKGVLEPGEVEEVVRQLREREEEGLERAGTGPGE